MKEHPIIMSGNHPKLILDGIKTMTRRVIKPLPYNNTRFIIPPNEWKKYWTFSRIEDDQSAHCVKCPYGQVGDRLWVREILYKSPSYDVTNGKHFAYYKADHLIVEAGRWEWQKPTLPSIFMPRWASRITLEITGIRVERVQEISIDDAFSEGTPMPYERGDGLWNDPYVLPPFQELWDSLNAKRGYGWEVNPWVWVISFKRIEK